jgi:GNAT superfamily N-acetyltransferase
VAMDGERIISTCYIAIISNLSRNGRSIEFIENVITDENYRRKGIEKNIMKMSIKYAKENNCYKIILENKNKRKDDHKFNEKI